VISGFSLGLVFVPLSTVTLGALPPEKIGNGSGLFNLMRNIGGSVGISLVNTIVARHQQLHQSEMVKQYAPTRGIFEANLSQITRYLTTQTDPVTAQRQAQGLLGRIFDQQTALWSYVDDFRYMALACFACVPVVWALRRVRGRAIAAE
jgi:MFS transporter, DHA2 family, multidrug resistance protein